MAYTLNLKKLVYFAIGGLEKWKKIPTDHQDEIIVDAGTLQDDLLTM